MGKSSYTDPTAMIETGENRRYGTIGVKMMQSPIFRSLSAGAQRMYLCCRCQAQSVEGRKCLHEHGKAEGVEYNPDTHFVFPAKHMDLYGIDRGNGSRWLKELVTKGFIKKVESNKHRQKVNVYSFSIAWRTRDGPTNNPSVSDTA